MSTPPEMTQAPPAPLPIPRRMKCPVCSTSFDPRANGGKCPVCGEQVVAAEDPALAIPVVSTTLSWLFRKGNWRVIAVAALIVYQIVLLTILWIHLTQIHAF
ncbi:MAG TPA: hypothetical protein VF807_11995 [Ktedonobacterales bacterium]